MSSKETEFKSTRFDYVKYDVISMHDQEQFKNMFINIEKFAEKTLNNSRWKSELMTQLEYAYMCVGKAIRDEQIDRNKDTQLQEDRGYE